MNFIKQKFAIIAIILSLALFYPGILFQNQSFFSAGFVANDLFSYSIPTVFHLHDSLANGQGIPLWTDLIGNGYPLFYELLYPFTLIINLLPLSANSAFNLNVLLHIFGAALGTYLYLRRSLGLSKSAAVLGALVYAYCGHTVAHIHQAVVLLVTAYIPWNFLIIDRILQTQFNIKKIDWQRVLTTILGVAFILYLQFAAGQLQRLYYNLMFIGLYSLVRIVLDRKLAKGIVQKTLMLIAAATICLATAAPQLFSIYELVQNSSREQGISYEASSPTVWPIESLILFIFPNQYPIYTDSLFYKTDNGKLVTVHEIYPYIGILPLLLAAFAVSNLVIKSRAGDTQLKKMWVVLFLSLTAVAYIYGLGQQTQVFTIIWDIVPGTKFFRHPERVLPFIEFSLAVLAAIGFKLVKQKTAARLVKVHNAPRYQQILAGCIILVVFLDLLNNNGKIITTVPSESWYQTPPLVQKLRELANSDIATDYLDWRVFSNSTDIVGNDRIFDIQLQSDLRNLIPRDFNMIFRIPINREYAPLYLQRQTKLNQFRQLWDSQTQSISLSDSMKRSLDLQAVRYFITDIPYTHPELKLQATQPYQKSYHHLVSGESVETSQAYIYENKTYLPRLRILPQSQAIFQTADTKAAQNIFDILFATDFDTSSQVVIESTKPTNLSNNPTPTLDGENKAEYKISAYQADLIELKISVDEPSVLLVADTYYPGWEARLDREPTKLYRANYAFRAVLVPAGEHELTMRYLPTYWKISLQLLAAGIAFSAILLLAIGFIKFRIARRFNKQNGLSEIDV